MLSSAELGGRLGWGWGWGDCLSWSKEFSNRDTDFTELCGVLKQRKVAEMEASVFVPEDWISDGVPSGHGQENSAFVTGE